MTPGVIGFGALVVAGLLMAIQLPVAAVLAAVAVLAGLLMQLSLAGGALMPALHATGAGLVADASTLMLLPEIWALPLVVILGNLAFYGGIATRIYDAAALWLRGVPGGLAMAAILGCGGFAAMTGSSVACASTMGRICVPEMLNRGYDPRLATASVAVGGTLGALIPPSVLFVLFGLLAGAPVAALFLAGLLPGLLTLAAALLAVMLWLRGDPGAGPAFDDAPPRRVEAARALWPALLLLAVLVGAILAGLGIVAALAICTALALATGITAHRLTGAVLWLALRESAMQLAQLLLFLIAARLFYGVMQLGGLGEMLAAWVTGQGLSVIAVMIALSLACLVLGAFIEPAGVLSLVLPLLLPLALAMDMNLIWVGVILVKLLEIGLITPPVGMNVFVIGNVTPNVRADRVFAGVARFIGPDMLVLLVLILFPAISLLLPGLIR
ncbi:TRAP transporter large permease subunit [Paracoccus siganidrum]|uniref:TRAP transporter large permease subunit n=1 Tax=Paracoccus siganidrum TaxID=1276757 RepID=A0A419A7R9_9RHOB|nr:TRAP transporter large permease subunit [Paracoccus siganidrum]RJL16651.1 TRAP transporter large permease subunit [Paracoccus siganidrum]RMC38927.1 TRAP transporter large permease [Paracoccus siganidrum]